MALIENISTGTTKEVLDLNGPDGNVFVVIGVAVKVASRKGWTREQTKALTDELFNTGNYTDVVLRVEELFGDEIIFYGAEVLDLNR